MSRGQIIFELLQLAILLFGVAWPAWLASIRLRLIFKDFPPHRHLSGGGRILYPKDYEPANIDRGVH